MQTFNAHSSNSNPKSSGTRPASRALVCIGVAALIAACAGTDPSLEAAADPSANSSAPDASGSIDLEPAVSGDSSDVQSRPKAPATTDSNPARIEPEHALETTPARDDVPVPPRPHELFAAYD